MSEKLVITIGREFGSGGLDIGKAVAEKLGIKLYDKELLYKASQESGISEHIFEKHDEKHSTNFLSSMISDVFSSGYNKPGYLDMPLDQQAFLAQFETIQNVAAEESCVMVGRCADYALQERPNVLRVFISADEQFRIDRVKNVYQFPSKKYDEMIAKINKKRASYYNYYTNQEWGKAEYYDLCLNSAKIGIDGCVDMIIAAAKIVENA